MSQLPINEPIAKHEHGQLLEGEKIVVSVKHYADAKSYYASVDPSIPIDTVMYDVYRIAEEDIDLQHGLTVLYPITVNGECNMTRGHFHNDAKQSEIYCGESGEGLLLLCDKQGNTWAERVYPGSVHLIHGEHGHRLINTSVQVPLQVSAYWSKNAGYDYTYVEEHPFGVRVYLENGQTVYR